MLFSHQYEFLLNQILALPLHSTLSCLKNPPRYTIFFRPSILICSSPLLVFNFLCWRSLLAFTENKETSLFQDCWFWYENSWSLFL
ncbi:hypothetical protein MHP7448_0692 [Mesomycoplasma hyopneumoniae 7448]|uniref:Uncharacterized protein n=1 Tax=Mesomycoplasma hyopneumoniae (strain 7448) TaxID=262722 RepID=A4Q7V9_MESH7|nr:hypothetical protein MHP7448_0692 [Mesomycoplasma hyopneumoniae 7448]